MCDRLTKACSPCVQHDRIFVPVWFSYLNYFFSEAPLLLQTVWWVGAAFLYVTQISKLWRESKCSIMRLRIVKFLEHFKGSALLFRNKVNYTCKNLTSCQQDAYATGLLQDCPASCNYAAEVEKIISFLGTWVNDSKFSAKFVRLCR